MEGKLAKALKEAESNVYSGISLLNGAIVFTWTLLCLFLINRSRSFAFSAGLGGMYYLASVGLCIYLFKGIGRYLSFPGENKKMPVFIGHKLDTVFTYPIILMALIGIISNLLSVTGLFPADTKQMTAIGYTAAELGARVLLLPLLAFAEELMNLLIVSFVYKYLKLRGNYRLIASILTAALIFGILHAFGWGVNAAIYVGIAYTPVFFATLYTGSIWVSFLAHLYNDLISLLRGYNNSIHLIVITAVSLIPAVWAIRSMFRKTR